MLAASVAALPFQRIVLEDFAFSSPSGERQDPACGVFWELRIPIQSGRGFRFEAGHHSDLRPAAIPR